MINLKILVRKCWALTLALRSSGIPKHLLIPIIWRHLLHLWTAFWVIRYTSGSRKKLMYPKIKKHTNAPIGKIGFISCCTKVTTSTMHCWQVTLHGLIYKIITITYFISNFYAPGDFFYTFCPGDSISISS